jgi:glycerol-3-phosphate acyltransferase PlsY
MVEQLLNFLYHCWPSLALACLLAYLLGSVNSAIIVTKIISGRDIRDFGSGNAGATNVLRSQGVVPALITTAGDVGKSIGSVYLGGWLVEAMNPGFSGGELELAIIGKYAAGLCCILGHLFPIYFKFRGGKGVLATFGMILILDYRIALICLGVFIIVVAIFRMVSLGSICAALALPALTGLFSAYVDCRPPTNTLSSVILSTLIAATVILKHIPNIRRIINGTESKLGKKKEE